MDRYCKRLIEVDLPIKEISKHARREKNMRRGHVPMLHIWPATRPTSACRSVICASLWIDPADELCPNSYRLSALNEMLQFSKVATENRDVAELCSEESWKKYQALLRIEDKEITNDLNFQKTLRELLFSFIVDLASWEASTNNVFLSTARNITALSHNAINGTFSDKPLVIDSYAGGGAIPLEALRIGSDAFSSDLNPISVLINKTIIEYIPKYGKALFHDVSRWIKWINKEALNELGQYYPRANDESIPISYPE